MTAQSHIDKLSELDELPGHISIVKYYFYLRSQGYNPSYSWGKACYYFGSFQ